MLTSLENTNYTTLLNAIQDYTTLINRLRQVHLTIVGPWTVYRQKLHNTIHIPIQGHDAIGIPIWVSLVGPYDFRDV